MVNQRSRSLTVAQRVAIRHFAVGESACNFDIILWYLERFIAVFFAVEGHLITDLCFPWNTRCLAFQNFDVAFILPEIHTENCSATLGHG